MSDNEQRYKMALQAIIEVQKNGHFDQGLTTAYQCAVIAKRALEEETKPCK